MATRYDDPATFTAPVSFPGGVNTKFARSQMAQETFVPHPVKLTDGRVWDAINTNLPGTAAADDLAIQGNTFGTGSPSLQTSDAKATSVTQRARFLFQLPAEYDAGQTIQLRISAGMNSTISDGTATVDVEAYKSDRVTGVGSDLCTTAAQSINSLTFADNDFTIDGSALSPGDLLDVRITIAITDTATATAVIGEIGALEFLLDVRG